MLAEVQPHVALLRAVNVGSTGKLPMPVLKHVCDQANLQHARTYLATGNVVFYSERSETEIKAALETRLDEFAGKRIEVLVRTADELDGVLAANPFPDASPSRTLVLFLDQTPPPDALDAATGKKTEEIRFGLREFYIHYPDGIGNSKLRIPAAKFGTARNINTVSQLARMARALKG
uniref:Protein containing DUF1697 n=1 Tax=mine drainage metagenome TaxID=410659 RepID=E6QKM5_9ZZZZ